MSSGYARNAKRRNNMNHASIERSKRLQRVAKLLKTGKRYTTMEIIQKARVAAVSAIVSELRCCGFNIECNRVGDYWYYQLKK